MSVIAFLCGIILILFVLVDAFETVVLPRRVTNRLRITALFYRGTWTLWSGLARHLPASRRKDDYLSFFGPMSLILLLTVWVVGLIVGFALIFWAFHSPLHTSDGIVNFGTDLYLSGTTFLTLGLGDVVPLTSLARALMVTEVGMGFAFLALVVSYLPTLYQSFSRREVSITLLDARAGSPPTAIELLRRCGGVDHCESVLEFLLNWELWTAELLETHLSYPVLGYYRSQHENQSWLAALTTVLDTAALVIAGIDGFPQRQGRLTFAMARHTIVDLAQIYRTPPKNPARGRLSVDDLKRIIADLDGAGIYLQMRDDAFEQLAELRALYEPYIEALSDYLMMPIPDWAPETQPPDNWESTAWERPGRLRL